MVISILSIIVMVALIIIAKNGMPEMQICDLFQF